MEYTSLSLFFIPVFKWGKKYYVKTSCCGSTIFNQPGTWEEKIERNEDVTLEEQVCILSDQVMIIELEVFELWL